jgi:hypothetical protein
MTARKILVVASPQWMVPARLLKTVEADFRALSDQALVEAIGSSPTATSRVAALTEWCAAAVNEHAAITYAALAQVAATLSERGDSAEFHMSDLKSEAAVAALATSAGWAVAPLAHTEFSKDTNAGFVRVDDAIAGLEPFAVITFGFSRSALVEHAVARAVSSGVHVHAHEWSPQSRLARRGWLNADTIEQFYTPFPDPNRWTAWQRIQRMNAPADSPMVFDIAAVAAAAEAYAPNHYDGHVDRCNKCAAPKHKGRCTKAALALVAAQA